MTPQRLEYTRSVLKMTTSEFREHLDIHRNTYSNWKTGKVVIPKVVELYLEVRIQIVETAISLIPKAN